MSVTLMVPIVARAGEVALRGRAQRAAGGQLGPRRRARQETVRKVVLPAAKTGLATGVLLAIARGIGETAIVLICSGASSFLTFSPFNQPMNSLPLFIYTAYTTHEPVAIERAFGAAAVLMTMVLVLFVATRVILRDKSKRGR